MSLKYLNLTGLQNLVSDIKTWVLSRIPTKTSEITNDSGFITSSSLPTVNNATLTIQKNGTNVQTFTANASSNKTANITVPTKTSELTNDSGFLTGTSDCVHIAGAETITGEKTFSSIQHLQGNVAWFFDRGDDIATNPSSTMYFCAIRTRDANGNTYCLHRGQVTTTGNSEYQWYVHDRSDNSKYARLRLCKNYNGDGYLITNVNILRPESDNTTYLGSGSYHWKAVYSNSYYLGSTAFGDIVTHNASEFLTSHQSLANYVTTNTEQTITGNKSYEGTLLRFTGYNWVIRYKTQGTSNYPNYDTFKQIEYNKFNNIITLRRSTGVLSSGEDFNTVDTSFAFYKIHINGKYVELTDNVRFINNGTTNAIYPITTNVTSLGTSSLKWSNVYATTFTGNLTGDVTGNCSGSSGSCTGNAATATQFSANKAVTLTGDVTGTASSKAGWSVATTLANSGVTAGTYGPSANVTGSNNATILVPEITVDAKGRVTNVTNRTYTSVNNTYSVYNKTLTIQKNGTNVATFTSNSNTDVTANITVPTKVSELTNDSGYLTSHQDLSLYPYKLYTKTSTYDRWEYVNLEDTTTYPNGFNDLMGTGKYDVRAVIGTTPNAPDISSTYVQGVLEVEWLSTASNVSSYRRILQRFHRAGASTIYDIYIRRGYFINSNWVWGDWEQIAKTGDIPTKTSELTNDSGYLTSHQSLSNYVTLNGTQTITGAKTFSGLTKTAGKTEQGSPSDLNDALYNVETYFWGGSTTNKPASSYGILLNLNREGNVHSSTLNGWRAQLGIGTDARLYLRTKANTGGEWSAWKEFLTSHQTVSNSAPTLSWGATSTIGTIGGTALTVTMPANPNTDTDTKVTQTVTTGNTEYPVLAMTTANATATETNGARFGKGTRINTRYGIVVTQNTYNSDCYLGSTSGERSAGGIEGRDYNNTNLFKMYGMKYSSGRTAIRFDVYNKITDGAYDTEATATNAYWRFNYDIKGKYIDTDMACNSNWNPLTTNTRTLGTSSLAWKDIYLQNSSSTGLHLGSYIIYVG